MERMERRVRIVEATEHRREEGLKEIDLRDTEPGERIEMVEQITQDAYAFVEGGYKGVERRLQRHVVRLLRRRS